MSTLSKLPLHWDMNWILDKITVAGVTNHYGFSEIDGENHLRYRAGDFETVQAILNGYQTTYADEVLRPQLLKQAADLRWEKQQATTWNGNPLLCDQTTINLVDATRNSMIDAPESPQTCLWKAGPTTWAEFDAPTLLMMGLAIRAHIQACFQREKDLQDQILSTEATADDLLDIQMEELWP